MMLAATLIAVAILPVPAPVVRESVDVIERNFFYDDHGKLIFEQAIFLDWNELAAREDVLAWRLIKHPSQIPLPDGRGGYTSLWIDGELMREVYCRFTRETHYQYDPELAARELLPKELRRELRAAKGYR
ncbi:MAG: hypothetical protein ACREA9_23210 [Pyrinomonadaceae bacterium]